MEVNRNVKIFVYLWFNVKVEFPGNWLNGVTLKYQQTLCMCGMLKKKKVPSERNGHKMNRFNNRSGKTTQNQEKKSRITSI